jgi:hypothetical protein
MEGDWFFWAADLRYKNITRGKKPLSFLNPLLCAIFHCRQFFGPKNAAKSIEILG